jgi:hypothetical protein
MDSRRYRAGLVTLNPAVARQLLGQLLDEALGWAENGANAEGAKIDHDFAFRCDAHRVRAHGPVIVETHLQCAALFNG